MLVPSFVTAPIVRAVDREDADVEEVDAARLERGLRLSPAPVEHVPMAADRVEPEAPAMRSACSSTTPWRTRTKRAITASPRTASPGPEVRSTTTTAVALVLDAASASGRSSGGATQPIGGERGEDAGQEQVGTHKQYVE